MRNSSVPLDISQYSLPLDNKEIFGNHNKTALEIGFGEGEFIAEIADRNPSWNYIGIEVKYYRFNKAVKLVENMSIKNVKLIHIEASIAVQELFKDDVIDKVYINFPDPWPKEKHLKHRLINDNFLGELYRIMKKGAVLEFVSDSKDYIFHTSEHFKAFGMFTAINTENHIGKERPSTRFQEEFRQLNKKIYYLFYKKV